MKTTLELPDDLLRRTKAEAATLGTSMKDIVVEALEERLRRKPAPAGWRSVFGKASSAGVRDVERRLRDLESVDQDDWK